MAFLFPDGKIQIFAKAPIKGQVKTRLRTCLSDAEIISLYQKMLHDVISTAVNARICPVELRISLDPGHDFFKTYNKNNEVEILPQRGDDLGQRMLSAFEEGLKESEFIIAIGGDCVSIDRAYLLKAAKLLTQGSNVVIGPAEDGGYVLLGMNRLYPDLFDSIPWGESSVLAATFAKLKQSHINYSLLDVGWDVDIPEDLERYLGKYH